MFKKKIPESLCKYSSPVSSVLQSPNRPRNFPGKQLHSPKKEEKNKDKEDRVYFGTLLQWLGKCDEHMTVNKKNEVLFQNRKMQNLTMWYVCVFSFLQNTDQTTRWRSVRAVDQTATTPNTWTRSSAPSKVCMSCVCVWVGCTGVPVCEGVERKQVCVCVALNPGSSEALWSLHGSFKVQFHVSALVSIRLCVGWKYVIFSLCVLSVAF